MTGTQSLQESSTTSMTRSQAQGSAPVLRLQDRHTAAPEAPMVLHCFQLHGTSAPATCSCSVRRGTPALNGSYPASSDNQGTYKLLKWYAAESVESYK